jgi:N-acetylmuramoyl-L-alanine amidase
LRGGVEVTIEVLFMEINTLSRRHILVFLCVSLLLFALPSLPFAHAFWMPTVCIDAGHGGIYTGAISPYHGFFEKDINLDIALRIQSLLGVQGYNVVMTRTTDTEVNVPPVDRTGNGLINLSDDLQARCDVANASGAQCFVSIHNNASGGSGTETYYWSNDYSPDGLILATLIQEEVIKKTGLYNRGVKGNNFYVLGHTNMPSALVEGAFVDNPVESELLNTPSFRQAIAEGVAAGIIRFLTGRYDDGTADEISSSQFFTWYDYRSAGMNGNWVLIGNPSTTATANCNIYIGGLRVNQNSYSIPPGGRVTPVFRSVMNGPVKVKSSNGVPVFTSQRVLFKDSFNEVTGISKQMLSTEFYFTWYDRTR